LAEGLLVSLSKGTSMFFDPMYLIMTIPFFLLSMFAAARVKWTFASMAKVPARMSGAQAARIMLDREGLQSVGIEQVAGHLSDHYDPTAKVLRLSPEVYSGRSMSAVGVACHEAGHALQDASRYPLLVMRNAAVPIANFGSSAAVYMLMFGAMLAYKPLIWIGIIGFAGTVLFQLVNLPVEFDASNRARAELVDQGIISAQEEPYVAKVLNAAALTYVAATLQSIMTLLYFLLRFTGNDRE
jgi:uncharacterized protein